MVMAMAAAEEHDVTDRIFEKLDEISDRTARTETRLQLHGEKLDAVADKVDSLMFAGCALGKQHSTDITELKQRPEKMLAGAATIAGIVSAIGVFFGWLVNHAGNTK